MAAYEMLAQAQRDLTAEQVKSLKVSSYKINFLYFFLQAATKLKALSEKHYKSAV